MSKHTPGPWEADTEYIPGNRAYIVTKTGTYIGECWHGDLDPEGSYPPEEEIEANAQLMAAAPELLTALSTLVATTSSPGENLALEVAYIKAVDAIAKATGNEVTT